MSPFGIRQRFGRLDTLVLNASGGMESGLGEDYALKLNRDAQVGMLTAALDAMPAGSRVVSASTRGQSRLRKQGVCGELV